MLFVKFSNSGLDLLAMEFNYHVARVKLGDRESLSLNYGNYFI